jgi:hypothetical protein
MSAIEDRLLRDIETATRGVVVTDSDLRDARAAIDDRIEGGQQDRRRTFVATAAAALIVLVLGVAAFLTVDGKDDAAPPGTDGPTPTPSVSIDRQDVFLDGAAPTEDALRGIWRLDNGGVLMRFAPPDLVSWDREGRLFDNPGVQGRYVIDGETIAITVDGGPYGCGGQQITLRAALPDPEELRLAVAEPGQDACLGGEAQQSVMERVLPTNQQFSRFELSKERGWLPLTDGRALYGTWFAEGGGHVLELDRAGVYHVATGTGEQVDYGEWTLDRTSLTLTSWPDSVRCETGDRLVMRNPEFVRPGTTAIRFEVGRNDCGGAWTPKTWILVPYEGSE